MTVQELAKRDLKKAKINLAQAKTRKNTPLPDLENLEELCRLRGEILRTVGSNVIREIFDKINVIKKDYASGDINGNELYLQLYFLEKKYTEGTV